MRVTGLQDRKTERIRSLVLRSETFEEERILGALGSILSSGDYQLNVTRGDVCLLSFMGALVKRGSEGGDNDDGS